MTRSIIFISVCLLLLACSKKQTILVDGKVVTKTEFNKLKPSDIFSSTKWYPEEAPPFYHKWNKSTLIVIKTKKVEEKFQKERYELLNRLLDSVDSGKDVLIVQDGIIVPPKLQKNLRKLTPAHLSNAMLMDPQESKRLFGESVAKKITLIINLYDPKSNYILESK